MICTVESCAYEIRHCSCEESEVLRDQLADERQKVAYLHAEIEELRAAAMRAVDATVAAVRR